MKKFFEGFLLSLGMFSVVPVPFVEWTDSRAAFILPCFPLVGLVIGLAWYGLAAVTGSWPTAYNAAVVALVPHLLTGFIHLDGYMDCCDAILSRRPREEKLRILKDPHTGAFAVISLGVLFMLAFAGAFEAKVILPLVFLPVLSRCFAAVMLLSLPPLSETGYGAYMRNQTTAAGKVFLFCVFLAALVLSVMLCGVFFTAATLVGLTLAALYAYKDLKGVSGDVCGFVVVLGELAGLISLGFLVWL